MARECTRSWRHPAAHRASDCAHMHSGGRGGSWHKHRSYDKARSSHQSRWEDLRQLPQPWLRFRDRGCVGSSPGSCAHERSRGQCRTCRPALRATTLQFRSGAVQRFQPSVPSRRTESGTPSSLSCDLPCENSQSGDARGRSQPCQRATPLELFAAQNPFKLNLRVEERRALLLRPISLAPRSIGAIAI